MDGAETGEVDASPRHAMTWDKEGTHPTHVSKQRHGAPRFGVSMKFETWATREMPPRRSQSQDDPLLSGVRKGGQESQAEQGVTSRSRL
jgi:hypothetical protein